MNTVYFLGSILVTVLIYLVMLKIYQRFSSPLLVPIATTTVIIVILLLLFSIPYETYMIGGKWIDELLGPAVVALAYPLYQNRQSLKDYFLPIIVGVLVGSTTGVFTGLYFSKLFSIDVITLLSIIPKSVTSPVAMDIADVIGGVPTLAVIYVMVAGISGAIFGPFLLKITKIDHFIGIGIGLGTASHGIGTSKALEIGEKEGAISTVAMILSACYTAIICPIVVQYLL